jgi:non-specific serine/threonine protein kinase
MLETIREYAGERLEKAGEAGALRRRHAEFFTALAERAEPALLGSVGQGAWVEALAREHHNISEASRWAAANDPTVAVAICGSAWRYWWYRAHLLEGYQHATAALEADDSTGVTRLKVLEAACYLAYRRGDIGALQAWCDEGLALARVSRNEIWEGILMNQLSLLASAEGEYDRVEELLEESVQLLGDDPYARYPLANIGLAALRRGDTSRAAEILSGVLEFDRACGDVHHLSGVAAWLGIAAAVEGRSGDASSYVRESLEAVAALAADEAAAMALLVAARIGIDAHPIAAATALGAADGILERAGAGRREMIPGTYAHVRSELDSRLGSDGFVRAYARGRDLSLESAIAVGLASID